MSHGSQKGREPSMRTALPHAREEPASRRRRRKAGWKCLDGSGSVGAKGKGAVEIGDPERTYTVEPLEDPVPREPAEPPEESPQREPAEPEKVEAG